MKLNKACLLLVALLLLTEPCRALAGAAEDYKEARQIYLAAVSCMAAYQDRFGNLTFAALEQEGWELRGFQKNDVAVDAKFFLMRTMGGDGLPDYLLAVAGTESEKDVSVDLRWGKVPYGGTDRQEFEAYSQRKGVTGDSPLVHKGFHQYVQSMLVFEEEGADLKPEQHRLLERLRNEPGTELVLVGHSLGGAAATLLAARLLDMGVLPEELKVITFGAPAVGNAAFAEKEKNVIRLQRFINKGDPVPYALTQLVGGYQQFGPEEHWEVPKKLEDRPHSMAVYLDYAMKNYYDKQRILEEETHQPVKWKGVYKPYLEAKGYVAPLANELPAELNSEFYYMNQVLKDQYWRVFSDYVMASEDAPRLELFRLAKEQGCQVLIVPKVLARKVKDQENRYYITLQQEVYSVADERFVGAYAYGSNTKEFTPLEAFVRAARDMNKESASWLQGTPGK
ncbi:lipase family protein [Azotosporobacter soli]|uniref:lipase family protein n=1 Tax=Azotosporobacter soli TaxID=3055040 RepID=UPI0031FEB912